MRHLLFMLLFLPSLLCAQEDQAYLRGAVPMEGGKVVFSQEIKAPSLNQEQIIRQLEEWGEQTFKTGNSRIAYKSMDKGEIAIMGEEYLVFSSSALSLDRTLVRFQLIGTCQEQSCTLRLTGIRYEYSVSYQKEPEKYLAEEWITDKYALNKNGTKLNRIAGKFRKSTIDYAKQIFDGATRALGAQSAAAVTQPQPQVKQQDEPQIELQAAAAPTAGFVSLQATQIPGTLLQMLPDSRVRIEKPNGPASDQGIVWKGIGSLFGKNIATLSIAPDQAVYQAIQDNDIYRISFVKPDEATNTPWMILECRKQGVLNEGDRVNLMGEITNVWIK